QAARTASIRAVPTGGTGTAALRSTWAICERSCAKSEIAVGVGMPATVVPGSLTSSPASAPPSARTMNVTGVRWVHRSDAAATAPREAFEDQQVAFARTSEHRDDRGRAGVPWSEPRCTGRLDHRELVHQRREMASSGLAEPFAARRADLDAALVALEAGDDRR